MCLTTIYTVSSKFGGRPGMTVLAGSVDDAAFSLSKYRQFGITQVALSDSLDLTHQTAGERCCCPRQTPCRRPLPVILLLRSRPQHPLQRLEPGCEYPERR